MAKDTGFTARVGGHVHQYSRKRRGVVREGEIAEVRGNAGSEYYLVRWPKGHESLLHPGPGIAIPEVAERARAASNADESETPAPRSKRPPQETAAQARPIELYKAKVPTLRAETGDRLVIRSRRLDGMERDGEILEVLGEDGHPPYLVRWSDTGRETITRPGSDAFVDHLHNNGAG